MKHGNSGAQKAYAIRSAAFDSISLSLSLFSPTPFDAHLLADLFILLLTYLFMYLFIYLFN